MSDKNKRKVVLHIEADEIERIYKEQLGGMSIHIDVLHSRVDVSVLTGEDEEVKFHRFKEN